jgi:uncharacterized C2H2 Zn-finger protein
MENRLSEKNLSSNVIDLIDPSDKSKIDEYLLVLKCHKCHEVKLEPKQCLSCGQNICDKCKTCNHQLTQSRHMKALLDTLTFKCKNHSKGCNNIVKYSDLKQHLSTCSYNIKEEKIFDRAYTSSSNSSNLINSSLSLNSLNSSKNFNSSLMPSNIFNDINKSASQSNNDFSFLTSDKIFNTKINDYEGKIGVKCPKCEMAFFNRKEFISHFKNCHQDMSRSEISNFSILPGTSDRSIISSRINSKEEILSIPLIQDFYESHQSVQKKFGEFIFNKIEENKIISLKWLQKFENTLNSKKQNMTNYEIQIQKYNSGSDDYLREDPELNAILEEESKLLEEKKILVEKFNKKLNDLIKLGENNEKLLKEELEKYRSELIILEIEEKWAREDLESTIFINDFGDKCTKCGNEEPAVKKYFCQNCRGKFCVDLCSKKCKSCDKFLCPKDGKECKLCHKITYCETCQKKCFYSGCNNAFCPECYKKNEHQARNSNTNCKFFTCEKDQICDCLMTSMFCGKCEKRLCNKCLHKDKEHFTFLK